METVPVIVIGATGKVGREMCRALSTTGGFALVGTVAIDAEGPAQTVLGLTNVPADMLVVPTLEEALARPAAQSARVVVDFSAASAVRRHLPLAIKRKLSPVVGTTGYSRTEAETWVAMCRENGLGAAFISNFAIGAMLMMKFAVEARRFFPHVEIIELHHNTKLDAPSGTALRTKARLEVATGDLKGPEVPIHSVRLPGLVAHQQVIFGGPGQTLTITHDSISRESFVPGVLLAVKWVLQHPGQVVYDLEDLTTG